MIAIHNINSHYGSEMALVILLCRLYFNTADEQELSLFLSTHQIDWHLFKKIIANHQIRPFVYKVISAHTQCFSSADVESLRKVCLGIAAGNLMKLQELCRVHTVLKKARIVNVPYKGVILSHYLFGDYITRETADIDILVHRNDFGKVKQLLEDDGYSIAYYYNQNFEGHFLSVENELLFTKQMPQGKIKIEIHWQITHRMMDIPAIESEILHGVSDQNVLGSTVSAFSLQHHLLILLVHHSVNDVWRILRHLIDIAGLLQLYKDDINWKDLHRAIEKYRIKKASEYGFTAVELLFGLPAPQHFQRRDSTLDKIIHTILKFPSLKREKLAMENVKQQIMLRDTVLQKMSLAGAYINAALIPNMRDIEAWPLPKSMFFLYYIFKPFRLLFHKSK